MKIRATKSGYVLIETDTEWIYFEVCTQKKIVVNKAENPETLVAACSKWGYIPLKKSITIDRFSDIDMNLVRKRRMFTETFF